MIKTRQIKPFNVEKPSVALRQALEDVEIIEKSPDVSINMSYFHVPTHDDASKCMVCFAGAVMLNRFESDEPIVRPDHCNPGGIENPELVSALQALDEIRAYEYRAFFRLFNIEADYVAELEAQIKPVAYRKDPALFKLNMYQIACICERHGH